MNRRKGKMSEETKKKDGGMTERQRAAVKRNGFQNKTKEEMQEIVRKSHEVRKQNKERKMALQECMRTLLSLKPRSREQREILEKFGFQDEEISNRALLMTALFQKGIHGDVAAIKEIVDMMEKLDMFQETGRVQGNVYINITPTGEVYTPDKNIEQEIQKVENGEYLQDDVLEEWDTESWGEDIYNG